MKVFVTGGAGFIGSWIVKVLLREGHSVTVFDNLSTGHRASVPETATLVEGDLRNPADITKTLSGHDAVIHLAAKSIVPESVADPDATFQTNLAGGHNLLEAMRATGVKTMVYSSSAAVYGNPVKVPIEEDDPTRPISPYGATKLAFEELLRAYHHNYGLNVVMFRYFNPFGPHELHQPETHAIPNFIRATLQRTPIPLYWNGEQERDFFFVEDIAEAHVLGLQQSGLSYYNLGSGQSITVRQIIETIFEITGQHTEMSDLGERPGDPPRLLASITKVQRELGWLPKTDLRSGLETTVKHFQETLATANPETT